MWLESGDVTNTCVNKSKHYDWFWYKNGSNTYGGCHWLKSNQA